MKGEIYYVVGKPAHLKSEFFDQLAQVSQHENFLRIPRLFTTNPELEEQENIFYIEERDFELRESMGMYCLTWEKAGHKFGVSGEGVQWAQNGYSVVVNGSLHNLEKAIKIFPEINVVLLRLEFESELIVGNTLIETENARLDWVSSENGMYCPYVLTVANREAVCTASQLLVELIDYNRRALLEKAV